MKQRKPRIVTVLGDPAGIGPELVGRLLADPATSAQADIVLLADTHELERGMDLAGRRSAVHRVASLADVDFSRSPAHVPVLVDCRGDTRGAFERGVSTAEGGLAARVACPWGDLVPGESVAVDGACLTVESAGEGWFAVRVVATTVGRTTAGSWTAGRRVNLERALRAGERLGGHLVQGHVDGVGEVLRVSQQKDARILDIAAPPEVARVSVPLGSITVDGVSLTVNTIADTPQGTELSINLIPHTVQNTALHALQAGSTVNLEIDLIARYVERMLSAGKTIA